MGKFDSVFTDTRIVAPSASRTTSQVFPQNNDNSKGCFAVLDVSSVTQSVNEVQTLSVDATGGTYTLTFGPNTTNALAFDLDAAGVESALRGLPSIGGTNVAVVPSGPNKAITFQGPLGGQDVAQITTNSASLTGNSQTASVVTTTPGVAGSSITLSIGGYDDAANKSYNILMGVKVSTTGTRVYRVYPGLTAVANATVSDCLPQKIQVIVTADNTAPTTYSVGLHMIA
tara:strand:+ start:248 stop:934 length:687 start_codon:yes stop_codon:yes gene_type:complete